MLREKAVYHYYTLGKSCSESILLAANEMYDLNLTNGEIQLFAGFRTGMGCGNTCGSLIGAIGVLSRKYADREDLKELCGKFVSAFEAKLACGSTDCSVLEAKYKTENARCSAAVGLTADELEAFISDLDNRSNFLTPEEIKRVKGLGCLQDKRYPDVFNVRVITRNGRITTNEHRAIAEAADRFGSGAVAMTTRLTMEIQGVKHANIQPLIDFLAEHGLSTGGTGALVRPVVSCKGTTCQYGLADTYGLSEKIHEKFYIGYHGVTLPHKFKICVGGCPNNCAKPSLNDLGIIGQKVPMIDYAKCRGCKKCQVVENCPIKIAEVVDGKIHVDPNACNNCGRCAGKCPFGAFEEYQYGFKVYIGGRWGKKTAHGQPLTKIFTSEEEVMDVVEKAILLFRDEGISGERFADTVTRLGFDYVNEKLISGNIDKAAILSKSVKGGATC